MLLARQGCPHCAAAKAFLPELQRRHPRVRVRLRDVGTDPQARADLLRLSQQAGVSAPGVPTFTYGGKVLVGFDGPTGRGRELLALLEATEPRGDGASGAGAGALDLGPLGRLSVSSAGLPLFTLAMGLLDGFNPCAMWVLLFLLSLLVHWRHRRRMALVAGTFVLVSGAVYFAFMAAWLNVFLLLGWSDALRPVLAGQALTVGVGNVLDSRRRGSGFVLSIPDEAKPGLYARMRSVVQSRSLLPAMAAVAVLWPGAPAGRLLAAGVANLAPAPPLFAVAAGFLGVAWALVPWCRQQGHPRLVALLAGPWLALALLVQAGLFSDRSPRQRLALERPEARAALAAGPIAAVAGAPLSGEEHAGLILVALASPSLTPRIGPAAQVPPGERVWIRRRELPAGWPVRLQAPELEPWVLAQAPGGGR